MGGVRHKVMPAQMAGEDALAGGDGVFLGHRVKTPGVPGGLAAFDDERRGVGVELVGMRPDPAVRSLLEDEGEGVVEFGVRAEPDELAQSHVDVGAEHIGEFAADGRVDAVARNDNVIVGRVVRGRPELRLEPQIDAEGTGAVLQQGQHVPAPDPGEAVAAGHGALGAPHDCDVVPVDEVVADRGCRDGIVLLHPCQRIVGQDDAPAKGVIRAVAFQHRDLMRRVAQLHRDGEIQTCRTAAEAQNLHPPCPPAALAGQCRTRPDLFQA